MNFGFYIEKLFASEVFEEFIKENKDAYPSSGFFIIDKDGKDDKQHIDYFVPSINKLFSFSLRGEVEKVPIEQFNDSVERKLTLNYDFDFNNIEEIILDRMKEENVKAKIQKIIISLQHVEGEDALGCTVFLSGMGLLKVHIKITPFEIVSFEKKSFFDMIRVDKKEK